jgi:hypothetical protein
MPLGAASTHPAQLSAAGAAAIVSVAGPRTSRSNRRFCMQPVVRQPTRRGSTNGSASMFCGAASPPIFWRAASISASFRSCSVTRTFRRQRSTRAFPGSSSAIGQSSRSALPERDAARIRGDGATGVQTGRRLPPPRRGLRTGERPRSQARRTARDQSGHDLPH